MNFSRSVKKTFWTSSNQDHERHQRVDPFRAFFCVFGFLPSSSEDNGEWVAVNYPAASNL
jgi:hypothetical protein